MLQESTLEDPSLILEATSIYDLRPASTSRQTTHRARLIRAARAEVTGLREALAAGWDVALEVAHQEQLLVELEDEARAHAALTEALQSAEVPAVAWLSVCRIQPHRRDASRG